MKFAVVDIETTGATNKITEVAVVHVDDSEITGHWSSLVNPQQVLPENIIWLTGITQQMVDEAPLFEEIADELYQHTQDRIFVAHSVTFDYGIIKNHFAGINKQYNRNRLCTVRLSRSILPGKPSYSLGKLCSQLGIDNFARHRALGDALATAQLLKLLLINDQQQHITKSLKRQNREGVLPPMLDKEVFDNLPEKPGIYHFLDESGKVLYVGKAINIKSRINGHFMDYGSLKSRLKDQISHIDYTLTGSEFLAYLLEAVHIKQYFPEFNRAAKYATNAWGLMIFPSQSGHLQIQVAKKSGLMRLNGNFSSNMQARDFLKQLVAEFNLCPVMCGLQKARSCSNCQNGVCRQLLTPADYNQQVNEAISAYWFLHDDVLVFLKGRQPGEKAFIVIEKGKYAGYGFVEESTTETDEYQLKEAFIKQKNYSEITRILANYLDTEEVISSHSITYRFSDSSNLLLLQL